MFKKSKEDKENEGKHGKRAQGLPKLKPHHFDDEKYGQVM